MTALTAPILGMAALRWAGGDGPSFEAMDSADGDNVYVVTVTASDGGASKFRDRERHGIQQRRAREHIPVAALPQQGIAMTARLSDQDGDITDTKWQWYRGVTDACP